VPASSSRRPRSTEVDRGEAGRVEGEVEAAGGDGRVDAEALWIDGEWEDERRGALAVLTRGELENEVFRHLAGAYLRDQCEGRLGEDLCLDGVVVTDPQRGGYRDEVAALGDDDRIVEGGGRKRDERLRVRHLDVLSRHERALMPDRDVDDLAPCRGSGDLDACGRGGHDGQRD
jgi:hypothetical protein